MPTSAGNFSIELLSANSDSSEIDRALHIFEQNTPPRLRTDSGEIRKKIAAPNLREGVRYFAVLYRGPALIGFVMFGYYPSTKTVIVDHMVIDSGERGDSAFTIFTGLLIDLMSNLAVDYVAIEVESKSENRAGGIVMMRRLTRNEFGKAEVKYRLPAVDTETLDVQYDGVLMLKNMHETPDDFTQIHKVEIERIVETIYFKHYYDWYRDLWSAAKLKSYKAYVDGLFKEFKRGVRKEYVGVSHYVRTPEPPPPREKPTTQLNPAKPGLAFYFLMFAATAAICGAVIYLLKIPLLSVPIILIAFLAVYAGIVLVANGNASKVFDASLKAIGKDWGAKKSETSRDSDATNDDGNGDQL